MRPRTRTFLTSLLLLGSCLLPIPAAYSVADGETNPSVQLKPARYAAQVAPGERDQVNVTITNETDGSVRMTFGALDLVAGDEDSFAAPAPSTPERAASGWLRYSAEPVELETGQRVRVPVTIEVPGDARPGAYAVAFVASQTFSALDTNGAENIGSNVRAKVNLGSTFVLAVTGDAATSARIRSTSAPRLVWGDEDAEFRARVENSGDTLLELEAETQLSSFGTFASRELKTPAELPTLPDGERVLRMRWTDRPWIGWFTPKLVVVGGSGSDVRIERELPTVFVIPPWWVLLLLALAIALPIWSSRQRRRRIAAYRATRARRRAGLLDDDELA